MQVMSPRREKLLQFSKSLKSSIVTLALTASLVIPTAASAQAIPAKTTAPTIVKTATTSYTVSGVIRTAWLSSGGTKSRLGNPTSKEIRNLKNGGSTQYFKGGAIVWSRATGAKTSYGAIRSAWLSAGAQNGRLGYPTTNETGGLKNGGVYQYFQGGAIVWSPSTGARLSVGGIRNAWLATGATNGRLGFPKSNEYSISTGLRQDYQGGYITWDRKTGKTAVKYPVVLNPSTSTPVDNSPAGAKAFAKSHMSSTYKWGSAEYACLLDIWEHESNWDYQADNPTSDAFGIPQALPGSKMITAGSDWRTNSQTQIKWGLGYIKERYQTPCKASEAWHIKGWY